MQFSTLVLGLIVSISIAGCNSPYASQYVRTNPMDEEKNQLAFTCVHESIPDPPQESDLLFRYARWLQKNNQLKQDSDVDMVIERLYRIAAEHHHYKANINLQIGSRRQRFKLSGDEHLRLSQQLIDAGVATGYHLFGIFLEKGAAGVVQDRELALRYFRKAADTGSADAQYLVADKLDSNRMAPHIAEAMQRCAAEQGHGRAAVSLAIGLKIEQQFDDALELFQMGVAAGNSNAAGRLEEAFKGPPLSDKMYHLGQEKDLERAERYKKIWRILSSYSYANPKIPEINEIVPLPPRTAPRMGRQVAMAGRACREYPTPQTRRSADYPAGQGKRPRPENRKTGKPENRYRIHRLSAKPTFR